MAGKEASRIGVRRSIIVAAFCSPWLAGVHVAPAFLELACLRLAGTFRRSKMSLCLFNLPWTVFRAQLDDLF